MKIDKRILAKLSLDNLHDESMTNIENESLGESKTTKITYGWQPRMIFYARAK